MIMLDEAHERTLHTDIIVGLLRKVRQAELLWTQHAVTSSLEHVHQIMRKRDDLHLIVSSATLDAEVMSRGCLF